MDKFGLKKKIEVLESKLYISVVRMKKYLLQTDTSAISSTAGFKWRPQYLELETVVIGEVTAAMAAV